MTTSHKEIRMRVDHLLATIGIDQFLQIAENSLTDMESRGYCLECHEEAYGVEPDAARYRCELCGASQVYGVEQIMVYVAL